MFIFVSLFFDQLGTSYSLHKTQIIGYVYIWSLFYDQLGILHSLHKTKIIGYVYIWSLFYDQLGILYSMNKEARDLIKVSHFKPNSPVCNEQG